VNFIYVNVKNIQLFILYILTNMSMYKYKVLLIELIKNGFN